jgi:hypothetical protein
MNRSKLNLRRKSLLLFTTSFSPSPSLSFDCVC